MKKLVENLKAVIQIKVKKDPRLKVSIGSPCSSEKIDKLERKINWKLPSDYRQFLEIADGFKLHDGSESMLIDLLSVSKLPLQADDNQKETLGEDGINLADILVVGQVPIHNLYVFLDKKTMETVKWIHFESFRFKDFASYLQAEIETLGAG